MAAQEITDERHHSYDEASCMHSHGRGGALEDHTVDETLPSTDAHKAPQVMTAFCLDKSAATAARLKTDVPRPVPLLHEALIRVLRAGVCGTDLAMTNDYKPGFEGALGHEFVGVVELVGSPHSASEWIGKRVVGEINIPCNDAKHCRVCSVYHQTIETQSSPTPSTGRDIKMLYRNHCPHRHALGIVGRSGAFAEYITLPVANLLVVPDSVSDSDAVFTEPLAAAYRIVEQSVIRPTDSVAVLGDGRLGLLVAEVLAVERVAQCVTLIGKHPEKLSLVAGIVDYTLLYNQPAATHDSVPSGSDQSFDEKHRDGFDVVVECTGTTSGISTALCIVRSHGRVVMKSTCSQPTTAIAPHIFAMAAQKSIAIIGSRCGPFHPALQAITDKRVDVAKYLAATYPLADADAAFAHAGRRGALKVQLDLTAHRDTL